MSIIPYDEEAPYEQAIQRLKEARKVVAQVRHAVVPDNLEVEYKHNHFTRDIKPKGECPACDTYHDRQT